MSGGISMIWNSILESILSSKIDYKCLERNEARENIFRRKLRIPHNRLIDSDKPLILDRYLPVNLNIDEQFIFHSSYYRQCRNKNAINIVTVHDFTYEVIGKKWSIPTMVHHRQKSNALHQASRIVCVSENTRDDLLRFCPHISHNKVDVIYNGVPNDYYVLDDRFVDDYILFVGKRTGYKNFELVVEAVAQTDMSLMVCGEPLTNKERIMLQSKLQEGRYAECINSDNDTLNRLYNNAFCLAYPSSYEGFGLPIIEAQKAGCPVIAYDSSSIPEVLGDSPLLMKELTATCFIDKLKLLNSDRLRQEIIDAGISNATRFSTKTMQDKYIEIYNDLLK